MAGILDFLTGGGSQGGLLDFLRGNALNQQMPGGLPSDTANYSPTGILSLPGGSGGAPLSMAGPNQPAQQPQPQFAPATEQANPKPSPLDNAQWPAGPVGAPSNANASMPPKLAPMSFAPQPAPAPAAAPSPAQPPLAAPAAAVAPASPDAGDRLALAGKGFLGNLQSGPVGAILAGLGAGVTGRPTDPGSIAQGKKVETQRAIIGGLQARGVSNADITAALANPEYMKKVLDNSVKEQDEFRPATPQERQAAGLTGDNNTPLFFNKTTNEPKFGPPQTNVNVSTEKTGQAELAKTGVESYVAAQGAGRDAQKRIGMYDAFEKAAQGFTPGASAEMRLTAKRYLKDAGLIKGEDVPDGEVMQMISRQLGIHAQPKGQGAVSNFERELFAKSLPNMTQSPEGLKQAIDISRKLELFDQKVAEIYRDSARTNKGMPNYLDVQDKIAALGSPLSDGQMTAIQAGGSPPPAAPAQAAAPAAIRPPGTYVWTPGKGLSK